MSDVSKNKNVESLGRRAYKAFDKDFKCRGFQYEVGQTYEMENEPVICERGFHFCFRPVDCLTYYPKRSSRFAEVEILGEINEGEDVSAWATKDSKAVTNKIKIIREISKEEFYQLCNTGNFNIGTNNVGHNNSGNENIGSSNSGHFNTGDRNSGSENIGHYNSGDNNQGCYNSGKNNGGNANSGNDNRGDFNTGNYNIGILNCGDHNNGNRNVGSFNNGNRNIGDFNSSNYNLGCFNTATAAPKYIMMFNKPSRWTYEDWKKSEARDIIYTYFNTEGYKPEDFWKRISNKQKKIILSMPNFDTDIFESVTGAKIDNR